MNYSKIQSLLDSNKNLRKGDLLKKVGKSNWGFNESVAKKTMRVDVLEKMSEFFNVPISYWFEERKSKQANFSEPEINYKSNESLIEMKEQLKFMRELFKEVKEENNRLKKEINACKDQDFHSSKRAM